MYISPNLKTKKAIKDAIAAGKQISVFQPNNMFGTPDPTEGWVTVEGPHYPEPHKWYGQVFLENGKVTKVK